MYLNLLLPLPPQFSPLYAAIRFINSTQIRKRTRPRNRHTFVELRHPHRISRRLEATEIVDDEDQDVV